jgi:hypothetical protein
MSMNIVLRGTSSSFDATINPPMNGRFYIRLVGLYTDLSITLDRSFEVRLKWGSCPWSFDSKTGQICRTLAILQSHANPPIACPSIAYDIPPGTSIATVEIYDLDTGALQTEIASCAVQLECRQELF